MFEDDYVIRLVRQLAAAIARIAGLRERGDITAARAELARAWDDLGVPRDLAVAASRETLATLLRDPEKLRIANALLAEEAKLANAR